MHPAGSSPEIVESEIWPVFAETVGEDTIGRLIATQIADAQITTVQINDRLADCLHSPDGLHRYFFSRAVMHLYQDGAVGALFVELYYIDKIRFAFEPAASDCHLSTGAEIIFEAGLRSLVARVIARAKPLVINLCSHTGPEHGLTGVQDSWYDPSCALTVRDSWSFVNCCAKSCWAKHGSVATRMAAVNASPTPKLCPRVLFGTAAISLMSA